MNIKKAILIFLINILLIMILHSDNIFWGTDGFKKDSGITERLKDKIRKNISVSIISPKSGETVQTVFTVTGISGKEVDYVEVRLDNSKWQKAKGNRNWFINLTSTQEGQHTIYIRGSSRYDLVLTDSITVSISDNSLNISKWDSAKWDSNKWAE